MQGYRGQRSGNFNRVGDTIQQEIWPCKDGFVSFALRGSYERHRKWARWTYPIWYYVSVTGVLVYFFLYHWFFCVVRGRRRRIIRRRSCMLFLFLLRLSTVASKAATGGELRLQDSFFWWQRHGMAIRSAIHTVTAKG